MWQLVYAYIFVLGGFRLTDENCFSDRSCHALVFSAKNVNRCIVTSAVVIVIHGGGGLHVFFESFCKCSV